MRRNNMLTVLSGEIEKLFVETDLDEVIKWLSKIAKISTTANEIQMLKSATFLGGTFSAIKVLIEANQISFENALKIKGIGDKFALVKEAINENKEIIDF
jgi:hypothetical protein